MAHKHTMKVIVDPCYDGSMDLPRGSDERENVLVELLDEVDAAHDRQDIKQLGRLQAKIGMIRPGGPDVQAVLQACSKARKSLLRL